MMFFYWKSFTVLKSLKNREIINKGYRSVKKTWNLSSGRRSEASYVVEVFHEVYSLFFPNNADGNYKKETEVLKWYSEHIRS